MIFTGSIIILVSCFVLVFFIKLFIINEVDHLSYDEKVTPDYKVNLKDNEAKCELVIMPRTGAKKMAVHRLICMTLITLIVCLALKKDEKARKSEGD